MRKAKADQIPSISSNSKQRNLSPRVSKVVRDFGRGFVEQTLNKEIYNRIIENFVYESNPESIRKTQNNISLVGQRVPGVTLADGRVVDGNRRLTCLRRLSRTTPEPLYFETVIMDMDIRADKKQIKLLELAIQHGEEKRWITIR